MIPYASNTGTKRNLAALKEAGWRLLITSDKPQLREGMRYGVDNGAWGAFKNGTEFDAKRFSTLVNKIGAGADWVVVPDIVAGGMRSLELSLSWIPSLRHLPLLLPVQDGMDEAAVYAALIANPTVGIFVGGSTEFKEATMREWSVMAHELGRWCHVGRVNTARRIRLCAEAGVTSIDGTSASRYQETLELLDRSIRQPSLLTPRVFA